MTAPAGRAGRGRGRRPTTTIEEPAPHLRNGATRAQRARGKLTVRECIGLLLDEGSFNEVEPGVVLAMAGGRGLRGWGKLSR